MIFFLLIIYFFCASLPKTFDTNNIKASSSYATVWNLIHETSGAGLRCALPFLPRFFDGNSERWIFRGWIKNRLRLSTYPTTMRRWSSDPCAQHFSRDRHTSEYRTSLGSSRVLARGLSRQLLSPCKAAIAWTLRYRRYMECQVSQLPFDRFQCPKDLQLKLTVPPTWGRRLMYCLDCCFRRKLNQR